MKGFINRFDRIKGYGFITTSNGGEAFFHMKDAQEAILSVEFEVEKTDKGLRAKKIKRAKEEEE